MIRHKTIIVAALLFLAVGASLGLRPELRADSKRPTLEQVIPSSFGPWKLVPNPLMQVDVEVAPTDKGQIATRDKPYDDLLSRTYTDGKGHFIMLAIAYGAQQRQEVKIHRPELCYPAQGLPVLETAKTSFPLVSTQKSAPVAGHRMVAGQGENFEAVSYWIRIGDSFSDSAWQTRKAIFIEGLKGKMTDGVLFRVSQRVTAGSVDNEVFKLQEQFAADLVAATPADGRDLLTR